MKRLIILLIVLLYSISIESSSQRFYTEAVIRKVTLTEYVFKNEDEKSQLEHLVGPGVSKYYTIDVFQSNELNSNIMDTVFNILPSEEALSYNHLKLKGERIPKAKDDYFFEAIGFVMLDRPAIIQQSNIDFTRILVPTDKKREFIDTVRYMVFDTYKDELEYGLKHFCFSDPLFLVYYRNGTFGSWRFINNKLDTDSLTIYHNRSFRTIPGQKLHWINIKCYNPDPLLLSMPLIE